MKSQRGHIDQRSRSGEYSIGTNTERREEVSRDGRLYHRRSQSRSKSRSRDRTDDHRSIRDKPYDRAKGRDRNAGREEDTDLRVFAREISRPSARTLLGDERVALVQEISAYSESAKVVPVPVEGLVDEEEEMMRSMGFGSFESTKGKPVEDNLETAARGAVLKNKKRVYRQYMNRRGGFNKLLAKTA